MATVLDWDQMQVLRQAKPMAHVGSFVYEAPDASYTLDFDDPEKGWFCEGLWQSLADTIEFDQQLNFGFLTDPFGNVQIPVLNMNPALRGMWINGLDAMDQRPVIAIARLNVQGQPGWYTSFAFFRQDRDGLIYSPTDESVVGTGSWLHPY